MKVEITGDKQLIDMMENIGPRHSRNLMRATVHGMAATVTKEAKQNAPKDSGTLKKAIKTKRKKSPPEKPISDVIVEHGNDAKNDAFYWRFVEYGTGGDNPQPARPFIGPAAHLLITNYREVMREQFGKKLEAALKREAKRNAKK